MFEWSLFKTHFLLTAFLHLELDVSWALDLEVILNSEINKKH